MKIRSTIKKKDRKNQGGLFGGVGYIAGSAAAGLAGTAEGIIDTGLALGADLTGNHKYAEYVFKDNVVGDWHEDLTEDFNPGKVWQFGGDVAHGLGQSSWLLLSLIPGAQWLGPAAFGTGIAGQSISSAAEQTGDVGVKEAAYGLTSAALETGLEVALGGMGKVAKSGASAIAKKSGKQALKSIASGAARKGLVKKVLADAGSEFAEEFVSEYADTFLQKAYKINPDAQYSFKDALYAGAVGFASGSVSAGTTDVINAVSNQQRGERIIRNGNAQTLVNTANYVADKLAASGTNFKKAPEWVKTLRGEVDAYNNLVKKGQENSLSAQTILGEMQASLTFAQTQAIHSGIVDQMKNESEDNRAALAEYINMSIDKSKRARDYTAQDIADNTDDITNQLAIMNMASTTFFDFEGAINDMAMEGGIENVIATERAKAGETNQETNTQTAAVPDAAFESAVAKATVQPAQEETTGTPTPMGATPASQSAPVSAPTPEAQAPAIQPTTQPATFAAEQTAVSPEPVAASDPQYSVATAKRVNARLKENEARAQRMRIRSTIKHAQTKTATESSTETAKSSESTNKSTESTNKSTESTNAPAEAAKTEPKISEAKEALTDEQRKAKAREKAKAWIEWEQKTEPNAKELNTAREYVKEFDKLSNPRRLAIIRTIRSSNGIKSDIVKGVANVLAVNPKSDLEVRFAEGIGNNGLTTRVGNKTVIVLNPKTDPDTTIEATIAHELVHYLEGRKGYSAFAKFARKNAKKEVIAKIHEDYTTVYRSVIEAEEEAQGGSEAEILARTEERLASEKYQTLIDEEITASLTERALISDRFLKRYADRDKKLIRVAFDWARELVSNLKASDATKRSIKVADEFSQRMNILLQMPTENKRDAVVAEVIGEVKYSIVGNRTNTSKVKEWEKPITLHDVEVLRSIGQKSVNQFSSDEIKKAQKWAYKFYKELGTKSPFFRAWFGEWRAHDISPVNIVTFAYGEKGTLNLKKRPVYSPELKKNIIVDDNILEDSYHYANINGDKKPIKKLLGKIDEILSSAILLDTKISNDNSGNKKGSTQFMHYLYTPVSINGAPFIAKLTVEEYDLTGKVRTYNLQRIELSDLSRAQYSQMIENNREKYAYKSDALSVAQLYEFVKSKDEKFSPAPEVSKYSLNADGTPKRFYHGTNQGEFYEFLWSKTQRADGGFFGRGHYFTASKSMANLYGKRIVETYLSFKNPFIWSEQIDTRDGNKGSNIIASNLIKRINMARAFPSLFENKKIRAAVYDSNTGEYVDASLKWSELETKIEEASTTLRLQKFADGTYQWFAPGRFWDEGVGDRYSSVEKAEADKFSAAAIAFSNKYEGVAQSMSFDDQSTYTQQYGDEITKLLISMDYDASMQNSEGDEVVIFESTKIKSATSNIGTFDKSNPDIRYSISKSELEKKKRKAKTKAEVVAENKELKAENQELKTKQQEMAEKIAKEKAQEAKNEKAKVFTKQEVALAVKSIEGWTKEEALALANGYELHGMNRAKRENMISQIYVALHEMSAEGKVGPGSVAVKLYAAEIAAEYIDSAQVKGADGKSYHFADIYSAEDVEEYKKDLTDLLYGELSNMGSATSNSEFYRTINTMKESFRIDRLNEAMLSKDAKNVAYQANKIRELAEKQKRDGATESIGDITKTLASVVDGKGNIRVGALDKAMGKVASFIDGEQLKTDAERNEVPKESRFTSLANVVDEELKYMVEEFRRLRTGREKKALNAEEMNLAVNILRGMKTTIERYNKEFINGHWVDAEKAAVDEVEDLLKIVKMEADKKYKNKISEVLSKKVGKGLNEVYFYKILSPEDVISTLEAYKEDGLLKSMYHSIRVSRQKADHLAVQMKKPFSEFLDNKENAWEGVDDQGGKSGKKYSYRKKLNVRKINVNGTEISLGEAIYLLMLTKRAEAHAGLVEKGFLVYDDKNRHKETVKINDVDRTRDFIYSQLDNTDRKFLEMAESFFNNTSSKVKHDADMKIFGYSNIVNGYYVPMIRDRYSRNNDVTDARQGIASIINVYNKSFNKNLVANAKGLEGKNIMTIITDHADGLAEYSEMYLPLKAFDRVYNRGVMSSDGATSIRYILNNKIWNGTEKYFKDLFQDVQHQGDNRGGVLNEMVGKLRSGWVNSVLGANIKVVATQTTSLGSATQVIEPKFITKASAVIGKKDISELRKRAYKHSDIIEARNFDMGALKAQGNIDKVNVIGEKSGFLIGWMDERVCLSIFHAAELKAEDQLGFAVGTDKNIELAAKIADEAIYTTQAMSSATERSALQRDKSEFAKLFSMFTSDTVKNLSHLWGNLMKYYAHKSRADAGDAKYAAMLSQDKAELGRSVRTLAITGLMLGLITQAFKYLYATNDEEEPIKDALIDVASSTLNIFPIASDVIDKLFFGYDISMNVLDLANDTIESVSKSAKLTGKAMSGEYVSTQEVGSATVNLVMAGAQVFGIPLAPVERTVSGLLRRVAPSAVYGYDAMLSSPSYTADIKKAVESGDDNLAEYVLEQLYKNEVSGTYSNAEIEEVARLYALTDESGNHYNVLPKKIGREVGDVTLTSAQRKQFKRIYSQASAEVNKLISGPYYASLNDEQKAKAIRNIYSMFYNRAATEIAGEEMTNAVAYSYLTSNYTALFAAQAYKSGLSAQKDAQGKQISVGQQFVDYAKNLGLSESDYVVVTYANGIRNKENKAALLAYINSLSMAAELKAQIAAVLGFDIKDGVVVERAE